MGLFSFWSLRKILLSLKFFQICESEFMIRKLSVFIGFKNCVCTRSPQVSRVNPFTVELARILQYRCDSKTFSNLLIVLRPMSFIRSFINLDWLSLIWMKRIEPSSSDLVLSIQLFPFFGKKIILEFKKTRHFTRKTTQLSCYFWRLLTSLHQKISGRSFLCDRTTLGRGFRGGIQQKSILSVSFNFFGAEMKELSWDERIAFFPNL